jgi:hypothetical protein
MNALICEHGIGNLGGSQIKGLGQPIAWPEPSIRLARPSTAQVETRFYLSERLEVK